MKVLLFCNAFIITYFLKLNLICFTSTPMEMWHNKTRFKNRNHRKLELIRFVNYYNTVKLHKGIDSKTPMEQLINYFYPTEL